jgi:SAM-dependent methyltransferase
MSTDDRRQRLVDFVAFVAEHIRGDEKGEAQTFLDRLFRAYGQPGAIEAGAVYEDRVKRAGRRGTGFADLVWEDIVLIEMKKRGEALAGHVQQMLDYWVGLAGRRPAYSILCNFDEFWIFDFNKDILVPVEKLALADLPDRYDALAFLFPTREEPVFGADHEAVTREAADHLAAVFRSLTERGIERARAQRFVLQMLVALFAEDIDLLEKNFVFRLLEACTSPAKAYDMLHGLFAAMNTPGGVSGGRYKGVKYFNGGLFAESAAVELDKTEVRHLCEASAKDWSRVRPEIFGTIFEHSLDQAERHAFGAHFTSQLDILKIVKPTIVDPWEALIERTARGKKPLENLNRLHQRLQQFRVLDPACGSGNFLYLAYRELKRIEVKLVEAIMDASSEKTPMFGRVTARQFFGVDINPFAIELAKVTLMIARKLAIDELHMDEVALPLDNLDANFITADALIDFGDGEAEPVRARWPEADVIIGNPPFLGAKRLKPEHGPDYVNAVRKLYPDIPGMADFCVYWIRRSHDHLPECTKADPVAGRAGLVGTQNIRNNKSRVGGLDHVVKTGVIVEAVDNQPWSGEANVHVSIANWVKTKKPDKAGKSLLVPEKLRLWVQAESKKSGAKKKSKKSVRKDKSYELTYREAEVINSALSDQTDLSEAVALNCNKTPPCSFVGLMPGYMGYLLSRSEYQSILTSDPTSSKVIYPYVVGREFLSGDSDSARWIIDMFGLSVLEAQRYVAAFDWLKANVLPEIKNRLADAKTGNTDMVSSRNDHLARWWTIWSPKHELRDSLSGKQRFLASSRIQSVPFIFDFLSTHTRPSDKIQAFAFDDDYSFGIVSSECHCLWFRSRAARLKNENDYNYSGVSVFNTFPWPQSPSKADILAVAQAGRDIRALRDEHLPHMTGGLRALYRTLELPGKNPLKDAHAALDAAVLKAYGFSATKDLLTQLLDLNTAVAAAEAKGEPVTAPGIPSSFEAEGGHKADLITDDCIEPPSL